jgi:hypothetical protein
VEAKGKDRDIMCQSLVKATYALLFFGVPHRGIKLDDVVNMLEGESQAQGVSLVQEIIAASSEITIDVERFINLTMDMKIVSFYETGLTREVAKVCTFCFLCRRWRHHG